MAKLLIEIGCEPGQKLCGQCTRLMVLNNGFSLCGIFGEPVPKKQGWLYRCDACLAAEKAAIPNTDNADGNEFLRLATSTGFEQRLFFRGAMIIPGPGK
jgi:hypothetical protein